MPINYFNIENGVIGFSQRDYQTALHAHFSIEIAFSLSGSLHVSTNNQQYRNIQSVFIDSNVSHTFSCRQSECQLYFIDPTSTIGRQIVTDYNCKGEGIVILDKIDPEKFKKNYLTGGNPVLVLPPKDRDSRIQRCLDWIEINYSMEGITIAKISQEVFLSESRLAHLFKEQIGISMHQYVLWTKIEKAVEKALEGFSLTECAYSSGFTDASHLTKTFKKMFGVYPSFAVKK